mmetsp:Transcript_26937/g.54975  ORF Transcript_26937/g.54975 Transcript_26937/m.54975 type:complete len:367 (-) Transcript_26937:51-1151(-)
MAKMIKGKQLGLLSLAAASKLAPTLAWGGSGSNSDTSMFYENERSNWMNDAGSVSIKVEGCVWATTDDNEDVGCMEDESGDGTTYWYQMAMCRRAQVAYSVYTSSSSSTSCNNGSYRGTYVTQDGLSEFAYIMGSYGGAISENDIGDLPMCEQGNNGYYMSVGCASDGSFTIDTFSDGYCLEREGTYDNLSSVNSIIKSNFKSCYNVYSSDSGSTWDYSAAGALIDASKPCTSLDSPLCSSTSRVEEASSGKISTLSSAGHSIKNFNVANKAKYALGTLCLIGSLFMFLGILFTNRRKRRAMMQRKMRASKRERARRSSSKGRSSSRHKSSASRSRSRGAGASSRSRSRARSSSKRADDDEGGVFA